MLLGCRVHNRHCPIPTSQRRFPNHNTTGAALFAMARCQSPSFTAITTGMMARAAINWEQLAKSPRTERAERMLTEAQNAICDLQTKLAHERLGKDEVLEAVRRVEADKAAVERTLQTARDELVAQRDVRQRRQVDVRARDTEFVEWWEPGWQDRFR